jgi:hypothetical protein
MKEKRLLVKTKDNRKFITYEKNLQSLVEFAKTFGAEIELVEIEKGTKSLELKALTAAICNPVYEGCAEYTGIEKIFPESKKGRKSILSEAKVIRQFIQKKFLSGKPVSLKDLKDKYKNQKLTDACLCNHVAMVRKSLCKEGYSFRKVSAGTYLLTK